MVEKMTEEQKAADFEARKKDAIAQMDAVLKENEVGIKLVLAGWPNAIAPMVHYVDVKAYDEDLNRKDRRAKASKERKGK